MSMEPPHAKLARIKVGLLADRMLALGDAEFLMTRLENAEKMLYEQQAAVTDASRRWEKIGYERGYEQGFQEGFAWANREPEEE